MKVSPLNAKLNPIYHFLALLGAHHILHVSDDAKAEGGRGQQANRGHRPRWPRRLNELRSALISRAPFG
jgi:hypothetical protein